MLYFRYLFKIFLVILIIINIGSCASRNGIDRPVGTSVVKESNEQKEEIPTPSTPRTTPKQVRKAVEKLDYVIGPEDLLEISVFGLPEMNKTVRVSAEGIIVLPLLRSVTAEGLTQKELEERLASLLAEKYIQNPQVTVFIREHKSRKVSILGAVEKPGFYELVGRRTILDIIASSGGITEKAGKQLILIRKSPSGNTDMSYSIKLDELFSQGNPELNMTLQEGDVINVPIDKIISIYVLGAVNNSGALAIKQSDQITVLQAIAQAGGFTERAARTRVKIIRQLPDGKKETIKINIKDIINGKKDDIQLHEGDVIVVPETFF